jgi:hypothetical protein
MRGTRQGFGQSLFACGNRGLSESLAQEALDGKYAQYILSPDRRMKRRTEEGVEGSNDTVILRGQGLEQNGALKSR